MKRKHRKKVEKPLPTPGTLRQKILTPKISSQLAKPVNETYSISKPLVFQICQFINKIDFLAISVYASVNKGFGIKRCTLYSTVFTSGILAIDLKGSLDELITFCSDLRQGFSHLLRTCGRKWYYFLFSQLTTLTSFEQWWRPLKFTFPGNPVNNSS